MKFNMEVPQEPNASPGEDIADITFQNIAGEAYTRLLELQEKLNYDKSLTEEQTAHIRAEITSLRNTMEGIDELRDAA